MKNSTTRDQFSRILVVDDDAELGGIEARALQRHGHMVDVEQTALAAVQRLHHGCYAAVVLDYRLAEGTGWPVLDAAHACVPPVPVVVVTGMGGEEVAAEALRRGAADYLVKAGDLVRMLPITVDTAVRAAAQRQVADHTQALAVARAELAEQLQARARADRRYQAIFDHATVAILVTGLADSRIVDANHQAELLLRLPRDQLLGRMVTDFRKEESAEASEYRRIQLGSGAEPDTSVLQFLRGDGTEGLANVHSTVIEVDGEQLVLSMAKDVSEQIHTENALVESEARYASLLANIPDLLWRADVTGLPLFVSPAVERITGFTAEEVYAGGHSIWPQRVFAGDIEAVRDGIAATAEGDPFDAKFRFQHKAGHLIWLHCRAVRVELADGTFVVEGLASDITQTKMLEDQFLQSQRLEAVGQLTSGVAHDFNNLMSAILAGATFIDLDLPTDHPCRNDARDIIAAAESAARLTRQLLAFSRTQHMEPMVVDLHETLRSMERILRRTISADIALSIDAQPELPSVLVDVGQLEQVVLNLVVNARDAMPNGGELAIEIAEADAGAVAGLQVEPGAYLRIAVRDTGHGMDAATMGRIFEPFFTTKGPEKGTGLGLATSYGIVRQSGGDISVESQPGIGTTFCVYLPQSTAKEPSGKQPGLARAPVLQPNLKVLVVDDHPALLRAISRALEGAGHLALTASCLAEAVEICRAQAGQLHVVVSDVVMAGGSGPEVVAALRAIQPNLRAILTSGYTSHSALRSGQMPAGVRFLQKPFDPQTLAKIMAELMEDGAS